MNATTHAIARMQKRAIPSIVVDLLFRYGVRERASGHASIIYFNKKGRSNLIQEIDCDVYKTIEKKLHSYLIVKDGVIITSGYRRKRIMRNL